MQPNFSRRKSSSKAKSLWFNILLLLAQKLRGRIDENGNLYPSEIVDSTKSEALSASLQKGKNSGLPILPDTRMSVVFTETKY